MFMTKLATMLALLGGVTRVDNSGAHIRGEVHMLLIGDPGTGGVEQLGSCTEPTVRRCSWMDRICRYALASQPTAARVSW
jgi:DNA replicative helicase MCM subunit Mcm2 (Cdc46/Mcm family)